MAPTSGYPLRRAAHFCALLTSPPACWRHWRYCCALAFPPGAVVVVPPGAVVAAPPPALVPSAERSWPESSEKGRELAGAVTLWGWLRLASVRSNVRSPPVRPLA